MTDTDHFRRFERVSSVMETEHGLQAELHDEKLEYRRRPPERDPRHHQSRTAASSTHSRRLPYASTRWPSTRRSRSTATPTLSGCAHPQFS